MSPFTIVIRLTVLPRSPPSRMSFDNTARSANFPFARVPLSFSASSAYAEPRV